MTMLISVLRGINVSGHNKIIMSDLAQIYKDLGFENIKTYIQSGNVVFSSVKDNDPDQISDRINQKIYEKYKIDITVFVLTVDNLIDLVSANPFEKGESYDEKNGYVTFLRQMPENKLRGSIDGDKYYPDRFVVCKEGVYVYCPGGYGNTKLTTTFFEKVFQTRATTRNLKTVKKLISLAQ